MSYADVDRVKAILAKNPGQLDALALKAEISESVPSVAVSAWLDLMTRAPRGDGSALGGQARVECLLQIVGECPLDRVQRAGADHDDEDEEQRQQPVAERAAHYPLARRARLC